MSKKRTIATVGFQIPGLDDLTLNFTSRKSLMDHDIIVFTPILPYYQRSSVGEGYYQGKVCYGDSGSFELKGDLDHWKAELSSALQAGKTVFLFLSEKKEFYVDTGIRNYSGTGRNTKTTVNVEPGNNYELLPTNIGRIIPASGKQIVFTGSPVFHSFFDKFKDNLEYKLSLENVPQGETIFVGKDKSRILGSVVKVGKGNLVLLPFLGYDEDKFTEYREGGTGDKTAYWTKEALQFGSSLVECLLEIDSILQRNSDKTPAPSWVQSDEFQLKKEKDIGNQINQNEVTIKKLIQENSELRVRIQEEASLKDLLFEQGKQLEYAVIKALKVLGFNAENYNDGELELDQVITGPEQVRCIGECEGKDTKDINIDKLRQLVESLNADYYREEVTTRASGILFGNAQRLVEPKARTLDFTEKCKISAGREKIALVKTVDLFWAIKYLSEVDNEEFKKACREAIYQSFGKIVEFPQIPIEKQS